MYRVPSQFPSRRVKKFFVRVPSLISQCGGKANRIPLRGVVLAMGGMAFSIKANWLYCSVLHSSMSNIIPLPFESALSSLYADASELAQAMQHLKHHLAHVVNI